MKRLTGALIGTVLLGGCAESTPETVVVKQQPATPPAMTFQAALAGLPERGMWKCDPVLGDVNGDGHLDLAAIPRLSDGPRVWLGDGGRQWVDSSEGLRPRKQSCGGGLDLGDVNHDGFPDLVVADHCHGVFVYLGDGTGRWRMVTSSLNPRGATDLADPSMQMHVGTEDLKLGDVNGDGHLDLLAGSSDEGGVHVYLGDGSGVVWDRLEDSGLPEDGWANRVELSDVDADGRLDVVATYGLGPRVWLQRGAAGVVRFEEGSSGLPSPLMQGIYTGLAVADIDEDGDLDLAVANWVDGPEVYFQEPGEGGGPKWRKAPAVFPSMEGGAVGLAAGRIDGDGHLDLVVSGRLKVEGGFVRGVFALRGDGRGGFEYVSGSGLPETGLAATPGVALGDVNGDGILDVAAASGLIVETVPGSPQEPEFAARMLVWLTERNESHIAGATQMSAGQRRGARDGDEAIFLRSTEVNDGEQDQQLGM